VLVNKLSYDLHEVNRGDIVVFEAEPNPGWRDTGIDDLVKRVIALPGETVAACGDTPDLLTKVCIDGRELEENYLPDDTVTEMAKIASTKKYGCAADSPVNRMLVRVPRDGGLALAAALRRATGVLSARHDQEPTRVQIDPIHIG